MKIFKTIIVLSGISLASGAVAADAPIAAIGRDAILNHAGVEDLGSLVGASIRDARGDSSGFIRRFNFVGDSIYAIVEREDGSGKDFSAMLPRFENRRRE